MENELMIRNVRCTYPQLWHEDKKMVDGQEQVFGKNITLLLSKTTHESELKAIKTHMAQVINSDPKLKDAVKKAGPKAFKGVCLRGPGEDGFRDEYPPDHMLLKANCGKKQPPLVLLNTGTKASEDTDQIYSGCRVNAKVQFWAQNNRWGKRINCKLIAVQFAGDDEPLDPSYVPEAEAAEGFDVLPEADLDFHQASKNSEEGAEEIPSFLD